METANLNTKPIGEVFSLEAVTVADAVAWVPVAKIRAGGHPLSIHGTNGTGVLTDLRIGSTSVRDGVMVPLAVGADLNAAVAGVVSMRPTYPACLAAGVDWELKLDASAADYLVEAKGVASSLRITGMVL